MSVEGPAKNKLLRALSYNPHSFVKFSQAAAAGPNFVKGFAIPDTNDDDAVLSRSKGKVNSKSTASSVMESVSTPTPSFRTAAVSSIPASASDMLVKIIEKQKREIAMTNNLLKQQKTKE